MGAVNNPSMAILPDRDFGEMHDSENTDAFVIDTQNEIHVYNTGGLHVGHVESVGFDIGGTGTSHAIASVADGSVSGDIEVTTGDAHGLAANDIVSQTGLADAAYVGVFLVERIISTTQYEVTAAFTATGTGTMNQAATLEIEDAGEYVVIWSASATSSSNNDTFDYALTIDAVTDEGSTSRRKFGTAADFGSFGGTFIHVFTANQKLAFCITNISGTGNLTIRDFTMLVHRL